MTIGISKCDLEDRLKVNLEFYDDDDPTITTLRWLISTCRELDNITEFDNDKEKPDPSFHGDCI